MKNIAAQELGKLSHRKSPRSKEFYSAMGKLSAKVKKKNKLSPTNLRKLKEKI